MFRKFLIIFLVLLASILTSINTYAERNCLSIWTSDYWTFKEYCYKITDSFLDLRNKYEVDWKVNTNFAAKILKYSKIALDYLPDSLSNKNYYNHLKTAIEKWVKYPEDPNSFNDIEKAIDDYINKTKVQEISWKIDVYPKKWNAPLTVTLRWDVKDPSWTKLENYNYTWWINDKWNKKIIWNKVFMNYTFLEEGNYSVFLDVTSNHRNSKWNIDVLSFSNKKEIEVNEKIASTIIRINGKSLSSLDEIKFSPKEASYWLLIDATSSTPTSWTKFTKVKWDFWNWVKKEYNWFPKVERVIYATNWVYRVDLEMTTNDLKVVNRQFDIVIREPIATIKSNKTEWFLWDKFSFTANPSYKDDNLSYAWEIIDLNKDKVIFKWAQTTFAYSFPSKWRYNVKLSVTSPSWEKDFDSKIVYINSRAPIADFKATIPFKHKPSIVFLDGTKSYDLDSSDDWKLEYNWIIDWDRVKLDNPNKNWSNWYYTFSSLWEHSITLEVIDPDDISSQKKGKIKIDSLLNLDFFIFPRVSQVWSFVKFVAESPNATFYEWSFWDNVVDWWSKNTMTHRYKESGVYNVTLKVWNKENKQNSYTKKIYVSDANKPYAIISVGNQTNWNYKYEEDACDGKGAYIVDRINNVNFSAKESIDITWENKWLSYSWKLWEDFYSKDTFSKRFDETWCFKIKLTVRSEKNNKTSTAETYVKVKNIKPSLSSLDLQVEDLNADPVIVNVKAVWAKDKDGIIQSYLWYYYTDTTNEPQDFRITKWDSTTFVLPKISWNYYFVVILKDNNEDRVNSEDITSRYFVTLSWDNLNTPIVSLKVNNSSVAVWEEVIFTANAENILTKNINKESRFFWDFDWDWFYEKETSSNTATYKYKKPWKMRAKVKVSHKGFSNTRTTTINVSNILKPDFNYVSIWNKFVFFNETSGTVTKYYWNMWDWEVLNKNTSFVYEYKDNKANHIVKLKVEDGTKLKDVSKKVVKNLANFIDVKKSDLSLFSNYNIKNNEIVLDIEPKNLYLYPATKLEWVENYAIDYDIDNDSDLNWGNDDDKDNKDFNSFYSGNPIKVSLNKFREQTSRVYLLDNKNSVLASKDVKIIKNYIESNPIDIDSITFDDVPEKVKEKFKKLVEMVSLFPKEHKLKGLEYIQKLKESWSDNRERTSIILEFEWFMVDSKIENTENIVNLLESLIVEWEQNKSEEAVALKALKDLIPKNIVCKDKLAKELKEWKTCYELLVSKLDAISLWDDLEENRLLWKEILTTIEAYDESSMSIEEKNKFKAILKTLIYSWFSNIPEDEVEKVVDEEESSSAWWLLWFFKIIFYIIIFISILIWLFFLWYKISNKKDSKSFVDFISEKTDNKLKKDEKIEKDPLSEFSEEFDFEENDKNNEKEDISSKKVDKNASVPDWLKWNLTEKKEEIEVEEKLAPIKIEEKEEENKLEIKNTEKKEEIKKEAKVEEPKKEKDLEKKSENKETEDLWDSVPDWLKWSLEVSKDKKEDKKTEEKVPEKKEEVKKEEVKKEVKVEEPKKEKDLEKKPENKETEDLWDSVPDWLKWSLEVSKDKEKDKKAEEKVSEKKEEVKKEEIKKETKVEGVKKKEKQEKKSLKEEENKKQEKKDDIKDDKEYLDNITKLDIDEDDESLPDWLKWGLEETSKKDEESQKKDTKKTERKEEKEKKQTKKVRKTEVKKEEKQEEKDNELWDDGMKVPDWLKTDDEK